MSPILRRTQSEKRPMCSTPASTSLPPATARRTTSDYNVNLLFCQCLVLPLIESGLPAALYNALGYHFDAR